MLRISVFVTLADHSLVMVGKFYILLLWLVAQQSYTVATKPNILMIVMDDLGWNDVGYKGSEIPTPTIDNFTKERACLQQYYIKKHVLLQEQT